MSNEINLITVPTFTFNQGDMFTDDQFERPVNVDYYENCIEIRQDGEYKQQQSIKIHPKYVKDLFRQIVKHQKEAEEVLNLRNS